VNRSTTGTPALFTYKSDGASTPSTIAVAIHPVVDWNPNIKPDATELQSSVDLRNLNRAPTASMSCQGLASGHAVCDATASTDPDGEQLTYSWTMNGTALTTDTINRIDKSPLTSKATYTFVLTVTDSAGVSSTVTRSVTMP